MKRLYLLWLPRRQVLVVLAIGAIASLFLGSAVSLEVMSARLDNLSRSLRGKTILIDPGHGGIDGGSSYGSGPDRILEKNITLEVSRMLAEVLAECGARPVLTRYEDIIYGETPREDLEVRLEMVREFSADLFVSIHVNKFPDSSCFGAQVFHFPGSEQDKRLATLIQDELFRIDRDNFRQVANADFFVLRKTKIPAVLVEIGFISNPRDRRLMIDPVHQSRMAEAIATGIARYFAGDQAPAGRPASRGPGQWFF